MERQFTSYEELLSQDKMADCAMVCTQDQMHCEPVVMAMEKGYHVHSFVRGNWRNAEESSPMIL